MNIKSISTASLFALLAVNIYAMGVDGGNSIQINSGATSDEQNKGYQEAVQSINPVQLARFHAGIVEPGVLQLISLVHQQNNGERARRISIREAEQCALRAKILAQERAEMERVASEVARKEHDDELKETEEQN